MQENFTLTDQKWGRGFKLEEYNGVFSLTSCQQNKETGTVYPEWVIPQDKDRKPRMKPDGAYRVIPVKVVLGSSKEEAIAVLDVLRVLLQGEQQQRPPIPEGQVNNNHGQTYYSQQGGNQEPPPGGFNDDIPF